MEISHDPDCIHPNASSANMTAMGQPLFMGEDGTAVPFGRTLGALYDSEASGPAVVLAMFASGAPVGLFIAWSPDGARTFARQLNKMADEAECQIEKQASAAIERARRA